MSDTTKFYTVADLAGLLKLSASQVYALIDSGRLQCHRFTTKKNGAVRISQQQLDAYLQATASGPVEPAAPPERPAPVGFTTLDGARLKEAWRR
jgi:excisionase family DNA binding protein